MAFTLPKFVNNLDMWVYPRVPDTGPADYPNQPCQIYTYSKEPNFWFNHSTGKYSAVIIVRFPDSPSSDPQPGWIFGKDLAAPNNDIMFLSLFRMRMHSGFPNVYKQHYCVRCDRLGNVFVPPGF